MTRFKYRHQYDDVRDEQERNATNIDTGFETPTKQSFAEDADINVMVRRFGITDSAIPPRALDPAYFGDFSEAPRSYREALDRVRYAQDRFEQLPAGLKNKFDNDPAKLLDWINDDKNAAEAYEIGLLQKHPDPTSPHETKTPVE